jgi:hypothetical protein
MRTASRLGVDGHRVAMRYQEGRRVRFPAGSAGDDQGASGLGCSPAPTGVGLVAGNMAHRKNESFGYAVTYYPGRRRTTRPSSRFGQQRLTVDFALAAAPPLDSGPCHWADRRARGGVPVSAAAAIVDWLTMAGADHRATGATVPSCPAPPVYEIRSNAGSDGQSRRGGLRRATTRYRWHAAAARSAVWSSDTGDPPPFTASRACKLLAWQECPDRSEPPATATGLHAPQYGGTFLFRLSGWLTALDAVRLNDTTSPTPDVPTGAKQITGLRIVFGQIGRDCRNGDRTGRPAPMRLSWRSQKTSVTDVWIVSSGGPSGGGGAY